MSDMTSSGTKLYVPGMSRFYEWASPLAVPLIRVAAGVILMPHGMQKLFGWFGGNIQGTAKAFSSVGLEPALPLAYFVGSVELIGGFLLAIGLFTRVAAAAIFILLTVAWYKVHLPIGFFWTGRGIEYPLLWSIVALAFFLRGGGEYSVDRAMGKEF